MTITWYGQSCFRIETREATLAIDPFSKELGLTPPRFKADLVLVTHEHPDHSNVEAVADGGAPIAGPGEYESKGVSVTGIQTFHDAEGGALRGLNTAYRIVAEELTLVHLGDFGEANLREETADAIGDVDILFLPVGGTYTVGPEAAARLVAKIEPRLVIPMHYHVPGIGVKLGPVEAFLKAAGARDAERLDRLAIRRRDLPETETRFVVFSKA